MRGTFDLKKDVLFSGMTRRMIMKKRFSVELKGKQYDSEQYNH